VRRSSKSCESPEAPDMSCVEILAWLTIGPNSERSCVLNCVSAGITGALSRFRRKNPEGLYGSSRRTSNLSLTFGSSVVRNCSAATTSLEKSIISFSLLDQIGN